MLHPRISDPKVTRRILHAFGLRASKRFGQNFLVSEAVVDGIVRAADIREGDRVLEIGPGIGTLTQGLLEAGAHVTAVEIDKKLPDVLAETLKGYENFTLIRGDILKTNIRACMGDAPFKVAANLPYYITTPILLGLLEQKLPITELVTMVQREVAERMIARPGSRTYGSLSVAVQYHSRPEIVLHVPRRSFIPAPDVESAVIACHVREEPAVACRDEKMFFRVIKAAFGQRRKTLLNALTGTGKTKDEIRAAFEAAGMDETRRGETLSLEEFARIADVLSDVESDVQGICRSCGGKAADGRME
ncbi:16S rRNA (adenine(1518)-N(6)/adenine(1519)-N(6)) -dimethyltransferase RsmA [Selenomonas sp. TAMA-11512]|uniref:16S rRNA (adenine(1518)-N(6)/adenine(1519)-N(6))- dimethyltransferase RsmA n=1 Tax=Selenomonas sp. TAMA-11512 TaxID=3095337 RepID=UPI00308ADCEB|nr:16S rRNA (adenine(1518)-N(6)/adenine(1519)-N(6)) -dimethyltransferase RsmA [Selenomonas sp. TAMA-11512]